MSPVEVVVVCLVGIHFYFRCSAVAASPASSSSGGVALELRYRFEEEQTVGTTVGNVARDANLARLYDPDVLRLLNFRFLKQQQTEFSIDATTGVIRSAGRIDRETICPGLASGSGMTSSSDAQQSNAAGCDMRLDVAIQPNPYFRIIRVTVTIVDVNDNAPRFSADRKSIEIPESTEVGAAIFVPDATDADGPEFGVQSYRLATDSDRFILTSGTSSSGGMIAGSGPEVRLILTKPLDRELIDNYQLRIFAVDGGFPPKSGFIDIAVTVSDVNDNSPIFDQESYEASIPENVAIGTSFLRVTAIDYDIGVNGELTYALSSHSAAAHGHLFAVDATTGDLSVRGPIDYEEATVHRLTVVARDGGSNVGSTTSRSASVSVVIHVIDINDNAPTISADTLSSTPGAAEIAENSPIGSFVAHLSIADLDSGNNGRFLCNLDSGGDGSTHFRLTPMFNSVEEFQLVTASEFDRERRERYEAQVTCRDFGAEPLTSSTRVVVMVTDQNDNDPTFDRTTYIGELIENNYVGAVLLQVNASDIDLGDNADIRYSILPGDPASGWFDIDATTGVITAGVSFDRENNDVIRFKVIARDRGVPPRSATAHVTVAILDVNDERPKFSHPSYSFAVYENRPSGTPIGQVVAKDLDGSIYGEVTYHLGSQSSTSSSSSGARSSDVPPFEIDHKTGSLSTTRILDRELEPVYHLVVSASDRGVPPLSGTVNVTVYVSDENDNPPSFVFPSASNRTVQVSAKAPVNHVFSKVLALDPDGGHNARITYSIDVGGGRETVHDADSYRVSGTDDGRYFDVDAKYGFVIVNRPLLEADGRTFELRVVASDHGVPPITASETLLVVVNRTLPLNVPDADSANNDQHLGVPSAFQTLIGSRNFLVVVVLAAISLAIAIALIVAIVVVRRHDRRDVIVRVGGDEKSTSGGTGGGGIGVTNKYNCRTETIKMLRACGKEDETLTRGRSGSTNNGGGGGTGSTAPGKTIDEATLLMRHAGRDDSGDRVRSPGCDDEDPAGLTTGLMQQTSMERSGQSWPSAISHDGLQNPQACSSLLTDTSSPVVNSNATASYQQVRARCPVTTATNCQQAEVNRLLKVLQQSDAVVPSTPGLVDTDSDHSGDGSNTDSGRGTSEVETDGGRISRATTVTNGNGMMSQYYDPRVRHQYPPPTTHFRSNNLDGTDPTSGCCNQVVPDMSYCHTYSPSGTAHHLSTFSVNSPPHGRPSTPPTSAQPYFTSGQRPYVGCDPAAASLDRKQFSQQYHHPAAARYAANACTDCTDDVIGGGFRVASGYRVPPPAGRIPGYHPGPAPSSPNATRRYPVAVRPPQLGGTGCQGNVDDSQYTESESSGTGLGQYSCADVSDVLRDSANPIDRSVLLNDTHATMTSSAISPEELCNEIDKLFFRA